MTYKHLSFNTTVTIASSGFIGKLTGKNDMIYFRNRYQRELDNAWAALMNMAHHIEDSDDYNQTVQRTFAIAKYRGDVDDKKKENAARYKEMYKCIANDQAFEERMWKIHQEMYKYSDNKLITSHSIYNKNMTTEAVKQYVIQYPTVQTTNNLEGIKEMERSLKEVRAEFRQNISILRSYFEHFKLDLGKLECKRKVYDDIKNEGEKRLASCRYNGSIFYNLSSEESKQSLYLDTITHRIAQVDSTILKFRSAVAETEAKIKVLDEKYYEALEAEFIFDAEF